MAVEKWDVSLDAKIALATKAKETGKWIFEKSTKLWYSPKEFAFDVSVRVPVNKRTANTSNFELIDPRDYIRLRQERIVQLMGEITIMQKRMWQYYRLEPKK